LRIKPDKCEALYNWGIALARLALTKTGAEADRLFVAAGEKYEQALRIRPDKHEALNNWGAALVAQAQTKTAAEADQLFAAAGEKYEQTLRIKPDTPEALNSWGIALAAQAQTKTGAEADRLFAAANDRYLKCESVRPGWAAYNLACAASLCGRDDDCKKWLETSKAAGFLPSRAHIEKDTDLKAVRQRDWFKDFVSKLD
jgi:tetratricopeptide (TPR) repeat protein